VFSFFKRKLREKKEDWVLLPSMVAACLIALGDNLLSVTTYSVVDRDFTSP
jgi:hypothetical protein